MKRVTTISICVCLISLAGHPVLGQSDQPPAAKHESISKIENGLAPRFQIKGQPRTKWPLEERMKHHKVPGVSIAVIDNGEIIWAKGYGNLTRGEDAGRVNAETKFQAASISKSVAAAGAMRMVQSEQISLDRNVNEVLNAWKVPENEFTKKSPVTLRGLLSHTAGLTVHGFPGYSSKKKIPSTEDVLDGKGNTPAVRVDFVPGSRYRYSGGGFTIAQLMMVEVSGLSFPALLQKTVLEPAGMKNSTYQQPLPDDWRVNAARAHSGTGRPVRGDWHTYPEMAAAGLWTTPSDLARFFLKLRTAVRGESDDWLSKELAQQMATVQKGNYGLGLQIASGSDKQIGHGGSNRGFRCRAALLMESGDGLVMMTNSDNGGALMAEIARAVAEEFRWPGFKTIEKQVVELTAEQKSAVTGKYLFGNGERVVWISEKDGRMFAGGFGIGRGEILAESPTRFFSNEFPMSELQFVLDKEGKVVSLKVGRAVAKKFE